MPESNSDGADGGGGARVEGRPAGAGAGLGRAGDFFCCGANNCLPHGGDGLPERE